VFPERIKNHLCWLWWYFWITCVVLLYIQYFDACNLCNLHCRQSIFCWWDGWKWKPSWENCWHDSWCQASICCSWFVAAAFIRIYVSSVSTAETTVKGSWSGSKGSVSGPACKLGGNTWEAGSLNNIVVTEDGLDWTGRTRNDVQADLWLLLKHFNRPNIHSQYLFSCTRNQVQNQMVWAQTGLWKLEDILWERGLRWFVHVALTEDSRIPRQAMQWELGMLNLFLGKLFSKIWFVFEFCLVFWVS